MVKTREKTVIHSGVSQQEMESAFADYARADAQLQKINAKMDIEMTKIREGHAKEIGRLMEVKEKSFDLLQAFAVENQAELFSKKKSMETVHGILGFRTCTPKLKTLKGFTWGAVTNLLKEFLPAYVRTSEEASKDRLLADRNSDDVAALLPKVGLSVAQDETFFVEPKKEE
jgi:phage host-nuclease inhibitor protein Gam